MCGSSLQRANCRLVCGVYRLGGLLVEDWEHSCFSMSKGSYQNWKFRFFRQTERQRSVYGHHSNMALRSRNWRRRSCKHRHRIKAKGIETGDRGSEVGGAQNAAARNGLLLEPDGLDAPRQRASQRSHSCEGPRRFHGRVPEGNVSKQHLCKRLRGSEACRGF